MPQQQQKARVETATNWAQVMTKILVSCAISRLYMRMLSVDHNVTNFGQKQVDKIKSPVKKIENLLLLHCTRSYPAIRGVFFSKIESKILATHKIIMQFQDQNLFYKRYLDFSTKTSNLRVNNLVTMVTFSQGLGNFFISEQLFTEVEVNSGGYLPRRFAAR